MGRQQSEFSKNLVAANAVNSARAERGPKIREATADDPVYRAGMDEEHVRRREVGIEEKGLSGQADPLLAGTEETPVVMDEPEHFPAAVAREISEVAAQ